MVEALNLDRENLLEQVKEKDEQLDQRRRETHDLKNQMDKLRAETGTRSEELRERAKNLTKVKPLVDERHGEIERLWGERW
jgi:peptidoglycan hydrolase CwlO-like protein